MTEQPVRQKFPQVDHDQATGELREVYDDIHATLRVPWVAFAIRVMSQFPAFVPAAWHALKPSIATQYAERGADLIRQASILPGAAPPDPRPELRSNGWSEEQIADLQLTLDALNYGNPKYLLLITAWNEAWNDRNAGGLGGGVEALNGVDAEELPYGLPSGITKFNLVDPDSASQDVQHSFQRVKDLFLHHGPASDYRTLAAWPDYLDLAIEHALAPVALSAEFEETSRRIRSIARQHIQRFPSVSGVGRHEMSSAMSPTEIAGLTGLLFMYNRFIPDITISIIRLKQAFEGAVAATENKFPPNSQWLN